eukprot:gene11038-3107_t
MAEDRSKDYEQITTLAAGREKRATAGNRMARLLNQEEGSDDEFYKEYYGEGVFLEDDSEFTTDDEEVVSDVFDSDFGEDSADEHDEEENGSHIDQDLPVNKKCKRSNVYKDPLKTPVSKRKKGNSNAKNSSARLSSFSKEPLHEHQLRILASSAGFLNKIEEVDENDTGIACRRSLRSNPSAAMQTQSESSKPQQVQQARKRTKSDPRKKSGKTYGSVKSKPNRKRISLTERLLEAVNTEKENIKSLNEFYKTNEEKKRAAAKVKILNGSRICYRSYLEKDDSGNTVSHSLVSFSDEDTFEAAFNPRKAVDTRPIFSSTGIYPPAPPISGTMDEDMPSASDAILYPNHVAPYMNIFHVLGVGK